jgi:hypothetical protein
MSRRCVQASRSTERALAPQQQIRKAQPSSLPSRGLPRSPISAAQAATPEVRAAPMRVRAITDMRLDRNTPERWRAGGSRVRSCQDNSRAG